MIERIAAVLWPAFLVAGVMTGVFFSLVDPQELSFHGQALAWSPMAIYTVGFFVFWLFASASSALTCLLHATSGKHIDEPPLHPHEQ